MTSGSASSPAATRPAGGGSSVDRFALVAGDFRLHGGMDRPNYELAWHLAEREGATVNLVAHQVDAPLAAHPRVRWTRVPRPGGRHLLGRPLLARAGRRIAGETVRAGGRAIVNGSNFASLIGAAGRIPDDVNWVHYLHADAPPPRPAGGRIGLRTRLVAAADRRAERRALRAARLIVADSDRLARAVVDRLGVPPDRVGRVYYGVDPQAFRPPSAAEAPPPGRRSTCPTTARATAPKSARSWRSSAGWEPTAAKGSTFSTKPGNSC